MPACILCYHPAPSTKLIKSPYTYLECPNCGLIFADPSQRLTPEEEKQRYDHHKNNPDDPGYRTFLNRMFEPLNARLEPESSGLDYGSGPGPTLHLMFEEAGHQMNIYDPFYAPDASVLEEAYDFITVTETAEHFYNPGLEFDTLWNLLKPGGRMGIMTLMVPDNQAFEDWFYIRDDTHVAFYSEKTFQWLAECKEAEFEVINERIVILKKRES